MQLSDYVELNPRVALKKGGLVPFVAMDDIKPGSRWVRPNQERPATGSGSKFVPGDTLFARITPCLENGKIAQYLGDGPGTGSSEFFVLRARDGISDPAFVFYFARHEPVRAAARRSMTGASGRQRANVSALAEFQCEFVSLPLQHRIAAVLSAYDELLDNNQRRIEILEAMARGLFREWFVHHRFPGYERRPVIGSRHGSSGDVWPLKRLSECIDFDPRVRIPRDGGKPFVPMRSLTHDSMVIAEVESREGSSGAKFQNGDTLLARITPCLENGKTAFVQFLPDADAVAFGSTEFIVMRSRTLTPEFVYLLARDQDFRANAIKSMSGASGRQRVQEACFDSYMIAQPPQALLDRFSTLVAPSFRLVQQLHIQMENLRRTRDLLLSRMMSGQLTPTA